MRQTILCVFAIFSATFFMSSAETIWIVGNSKYNVDTLYHATVGPGTTETELRIESVGLSTTKINNIFYTVTDLSNPYVEMRAAKAGNHMRQLEVVPDIAKRMDTANEKYFAGVNADFFNMGYPYNPIGMCVANGHLTNYETDGADIDPYYIVFDEKGSPTFARHIDRAWEGNFYFPDGNTYQFHLNTWRATDELILYTPQWQLIDSDNRTFEVGRTGTNQYGVEVRLRPVGENVLYGNRLSFEVLDDPEVYIGNMKIPTDGYVLSAHGAACNFVKALKKDDVITSFISFKADGKDMKAKNLLGGFPRILTSNSINSTLSYPGHLSNPEPRSAVGYNTDKSKIFMVVVDGRNAGGSAGVTQQELASIMYNIGCTDAMNFDGGGSSTMYVRGLGVKNVPSSSSLDQREEGDPRTVVNALFAVAVAPLDNAIASVEIREKKVALSVGESFTPVVYGYNQYGVMVSTDLRGFTVSVPEQLGTVSGTTFKAGEGQHTGMLTVDYQGKAYSIPVSINGGGSTAIDEVVYDTDASAEYFQLNGVCTSAPVPGKITIVKKGSAPAQKIIK